MRRTYLTFWKTVGPALIGLGATFYLQAAPLEKEFQDVQTMLDDLESQLDTLIATHPAPEQPQVPVSEPTIPQEPGENLQLSLQDALRIANQRNRSHQTQRERLYLAALDLMEEQRRFGIQVSATLNYLAAVTGDDEGADDSNARATLSRILPTGGEFTLSAGADRRDSPNRNSATNLAGVSYGSVSEIRLTQPLLAGAGYRASHENLIQAERDLVYAVRTFALRQQDFAIEVLDDYYDLLNRKSVLENTRLNMAQSEFLRRRSEALFQVRMATSIDVLRSQQQELAAQNQLTNAESNFAIDKKRFLITLGLSVDTGFSITGDVPVPRTQDLNETGCLNLALANRLDLLTAHDRKEDAKRRLSLAKNNLLPELELFGAVRLNGGESTQFEDLEFEDEFTAGIRLELPLDQRDERDAVKRSEIFLMNSRRSLREQEDTIRVEITENFSRLNSLRETIDIQKKTTELAEKRARDAKLRFKNGELSNRDVVEAENELLDARNAYVRALTDYEVQRVKLYRNMGSVDVDAEGNLYELTKGATPSWERWYERKKAKPREQETKTVIQTLGANPSQPPKRLPLPDVLTFEPPVPTEDLNQPAPAHSPNANWEKRPPKQENWLRRFIRR